MVLAHLAGVLGGLALSITVILCALGLALAVFYLRSLHQAMDCVSSANRPFPGGLAWLFFVPGVGFFWILAFQVFLALAIDADFKAAGRAQRPGGLPLAVGMAVCVVLQIVPIVGQIAALAYLVMWIIFWVQIR